MSELSDLSKTTFDSDNLDHSSIVNDELNEFGIQNRIQKEQQYQCINKLDQQFNAANIATINLLQEYEFNEIVSNVEILMNRCLNSVHKNDGLIQLLSPNLFASHSFQAPKTNTTSTTTTTAINALTNNKSIPRRSNRQESIIAEIINSDSVLSVNSILNRPMVIDCLIPLDFIRNGLKSGPLPSQQAETQLYRENTNLTNNSKSNQSGSQSAAPPLPPGGLSRQSTQVNISLATQLNYKLLVANKQCVIFKYLLVLQLNSEYFDCHIINDKESIYSVRSIKKPETWTQFDYDQFTVDLYSNLNEPISKIFSNIVNLPKTKQQQKVKPTRYLNSKAIYDRLHKQFFRTIVKEKLNGENLNLKFDEDCKLCDIRDNQLKICLKFVPNKGGKQGGRDLDILIYLNIAIKYSDEVIENRILDSIVNTSNRFFQNGGFWTKPPVINRKSMVLVIDWMDKYFKINLNSIYLTPNCVHHWSLCLLPLKLNFLVWLIWLNSFTAKSIGNEMIFSLFNGNADDSDKFSNSQIKLFIASHLSNKGAVMKTNQCLPLFLTNQTCYANSNLFLLVRMLQLFNYLSLSKNEIAIKMENFNSAEEELIADLLFLEMNHNVCLNSKGHRIRFNGSEIWSNENLFDRYWSCLFKLRSAFVVEHILPDPFRIFRSCLSGPFIKHVTLQFYNRISLRNCKSAAVPPTAMNGNGASSGFNPDDNEIRMCIEAAMRLLFVNIVNDDTRDVKAITLSKSQTVMLSDIPVKRQNTLGLLNQNNNNNLNNASVMNTVGSHLGHNMDDINN